MPYLPMTWFVRQQLQTDKPGLMIRMVVLLIQLVIIYKTDGPNNIMRNSYDNRMNTYGIKSISNQVELHLFGQLLIGKYGHKIT